MSRSERTLLTDEDNSGRLSVKGMIDGMRQAWGEGPIYQAKLKGPAPDRLYARPVDPRQPDSGLAQSLARGRLAIGADIIDCEGDLASIWDRVFPGSAAQTYLQEFSWLHHLAALRSDENVATTLLRAWLDRYEKWSADEWRPYFVAERLVQLCSHQKLVLDDGDALWRSRVLNSLARQTRHLSNTAHKAASGFDRLMTSLGLAIAGFCLPGCDIQAERGIEMSRRELRLQVRPDGSHVSRNPSRQLKLAIRLQMLVDAIEARGVQPPPYLRHTLLRVTAMAMFFRCGDGRLAVFNGGYEDDGQCVLHIQNSVDAETASTDFARHSGYHKLSAARASLLIDMASGKGQPSAFKSLGSFHFSSGRARVFTNCGNGAHKSIEWQRAMEKAGAHSTVSVSHGAEPEFGEIVRQRGEDVAGQLIEMQCQLLNSTGNGGRYTRRIFLGSNGASLIGEEILEEVSEDLLDRLQWRFHFHPSVRASLARDRKSVIVLLSNKEGWRFKANCSEINLEKSVYCGEGGSPQSTEQIVLNASARQQVTQGAFRVKWALKRVDSV